MANPAGVPVLDDNTLQLTLQSFSELPALQRADHDILIRLEANFAAYMTESRLAAQTSQKVQSDHEARIRMLESSSESAKGSSNAKADNKRTMFELIGVIIAILSIFISLTHHITIN